MTTFGSSCITQSPVDVVLNRKNSQTDIGGTVTVWNRPDPATSPLKTTVSHASFPKNSPSTTTFNLPSGNYRLQIDLVIVDIGQGTQFEYDVYCNGLHEFHEKNIVSGPSPEVRRAYVELTVQ